MANFINPNGSACAISLVKTAIPTGYNAVGNVINYAYLITNTGNVTLPSTQVASVSDDKIASVSCPSLPPGGLVPGAAITCTASYAITQADIDAGTVVNKATARIGTTVSPEATATVTASQTRALSLIKSSTVTSFNAPGVTIPYTFQVRNTGNVTIPASQPVAVSDPRVGAVACDPMPAGGLAPNATLTCTASYLTTQADVDAGSVVNTATASAGPTTSPTATHTLPAAQTRALSLMKSASPTTFGAPGIAIAYTYVVRNTGNVTIPATATMTVSDNKLASVTCPAIPVGGLAPNATMTCTASYTTTQADVDAGAITNTASATDGTATSPTVSATVTANRAPSLALVKTTDPAPTTYSAVGSVITYHFRVTNNGNTTITTPITVTDSRIAAVSCPALPGGGLAPGGNVLCTASYTITQADIDSGSVVNTAYAQAGPLTSTPPTTHTLPATQTRALQIEKTASVGSFSASGVAITYSYRVTNRGNTTLTNAITVADDKISPVACPALPPGGLAPNAFVVCSATYMTTQADVDAGGVANTASASSGSTTSPPVTVNVPSARSPALTVVKASTVTSFGAAGVVIPYTFRVTNSGNTTITQPITVADNKIAAVACPALPAGGLAPGGLLTCTGSYTTTQADVDAGGVTNTASATSGTTTSPTVVVTISAGQVPSIGIVKSTPTVNFNAVGATISYSYRVTNTGNTTLTQPVTVSDSKIASVSCPALPPGGLTPTQFITCTASYSTTQADVDAGGVTNTATARSGTLSSPTVSVTVPSLRVPAMTVVKTSATTSFTAAGTVIPYSYRVTNTGNTTLTSAIAVTDNRIASVSCPVVPAGLAPGAFVDCTGSYTTTQADVDNGGVANTAMATSGATASPTVTLNIPSTRTPGLTVLKTSTTASFSTPGASVPYSYRVTNSGNTTITTPITVADDKIPTVTCPALPAGGLVPGAFVTCTGTYLTTQADVDAGGVTNTASAASGPTRSPTVTLTVPSVRTPAIGIAKSTPTTNFSAVGVSIPYSYRITNTGNTTLTTAITVSDNKIASVTCPALPPGGLVPGAFITCTGTYLTTQADVDAGLVTNTAFARSGTLSSPTVAVTVTATQTPSLAIVKSSATTVFSAPGIVVPYSYRVTNTGNTSVTIPITVTDDKIPSISCAALPSGGLAPGASITCTGSYTTTQADVDAGGVTNAAYATSGTQRSPTVVLNIPSTRTPALTTVKASTTTTFAAAGVVIPYTYRVTNTGNTTLLTAVTVSDNKIAAVTCPPLPPGGLAPGAFITCTANYTTTQADVDSGGVTNAAAATSGPVTSPTVTVTVPSSRAPRLTIVKSSSLLSFATAGTVIPYTYVVSNTGNTTLTDPVSVTDDKIPAVTCPALPAGGLLPGRSITCTANYTTTQADLDGGGVTNVATARSGPTTSAPTTLTIPSNRQPGLTIVKSSTTTQFSAAGVIIPYSYRVTNTGNVTLTTAITVTDDKIPTVTCPALPSGGLAPAASITCTGSYTTTQADVDNGGVTNVAAATSGTVLSPPVTVTIPSVRNTSITMVKASTTATFDTVGQVIPYTYTVRNTGTITLTTAVTIADDKIPTVTCPALPAGGLAPNASLVCTGTYTVVQADMNAGSITNVATASSGPLSTPPQTLTIRALQRPEFTTRKVLGAPNVVANSDGSFTATFQVDIENTGNVDLTDVQARDDYQSQIPAGARVESARVHSVASSVHGAMTQGSPVYAGAAPNANLLTTPGVPIAVGEIVSVVFDLRFRPAPGTTSAQYTNTVTAEAVFGRGTPLESIARRTGVTIVPFTPLAPLQVTKTTPKTDVVVGELVPYTITVKNSDTVERTGLTIADVLPAGFKYVPNSASFNGLPTEPAKVGLELQWSILTLAPNATATIKLILVAGSGLANGDYTNKALVRDIAGGVVSNIATAVVRITSDPTFDCTDIIGKVFDDRNQNGTQDPGERGLPNVKVVSVRGQIITTDAEGRYHIACADIPESDRGTNYILKLDVRSLPTGYRVTTENPRVIRITKGKMSKINFGASIMRVGRLDLTERAFEPGTTELYQQWVDSIPPMLEALTKEKSVLRIAYARRADEAPQLAAARLKAIEAAIRQGWKAVGSPYDLAIEAEVYFDRRQASAPR